MIDREYPSILAEGLVSKTDALIRAAISKRLGRDDWTPEEFAGRLKLTRQPDGVEILSMDGAPLLELHPVTVRSESKGGSIVATATRNYRSL